ncbi:hypothetical protein [Nocardia africana]|uniref:Uncharacterized protein n=1 Tax=Nocardia africana TaxID=134964 RepID=A0ABW6NJI0_9NOCA
MSRHTDKDLAVRLMSVITDRMEHGDIDWNCRSVDEIVSSSGDPTGPLAAMIAERAHDSGRPPEQFMRRIYAIVDRMLGSRITFGPDDNPTYYIGTMLDGYIAAEAPLLHCEDPAISEDELELSITEPARCGTVILSGRQVDALIAGLLRWRAAHPDPVRHP